MVKLVIMDGQGGRLGRMLAEALLAQGTCLPEGVRLLLIGTNSIATSTMLKAAVGGRGDWQVSGATGENPVVVACRDADIVLGPVGIVITDAMQGEVTPVMAAAVGQSRAQKVLLPVNRCNHHIVGLQEQPMNMLMTAAVAKVQALLKCNISL